MLESSLSYTWLLFVRLAQCGGDPPFPPSLNRLSLPSSQPPPPCNIPVNAQLYNVALIGTSMMSMFFEYQSVNIASTTSTSVTVTLATTNSTPEIIGQFTVAVSFCLMGFFWWSAFVGDLYMVQRNFNGADVLQFTLSGDGKGVGKAAADRGIVWLQRFISIYLNFLVTSLSGPIMVYCAYTWANHVGYPPPPPPPAPTVPPTPPPPRPFRDLVCILWNPVEDADVSLGTLPLLPYVLGGLLTPCTPSPFALP